MYVLDLGMCRVTPGPGCESWEAYSFCLTSLGVHSLFCSNLTSKTWGNMPIVSLWSHERHIPAVRKVKSSSGHNHPSHLMGGDCLQRTYYLLPSRKFWKPAFAVYFCSIWRLKCITYWLRLYMFLVDNVPNLGFFPKIVPKLNWSVFFLFLCVYVPKMAIRKNFILFHYQGKFRTLIKWGIVLIIKIFFRHCDFNGYRKFCYL